MVKPRKNLSHKKKAEIEEIAQWPIDDHFDEYELIRPEFIAIAEGISYSFNNYNSNFEGLIECSNGHFHIYLNVGKSQNLNSPQVRFSFAHELGHYFIDEHRWELMNSGFLAHVPEIPMLSQHIFEKEADFFASCLLMPRSRVIRDLPVDKFNIDTILLISRKYQVSLLASLSRYIALGEIPILIIVSDVDGTFQYKLPSKNFPFHTLNLSAANIVPAESKAWEYCFGEGNDITIPKVNRAGVWFRPKNENDALRTFSEYCFAQPAFGKIISVLWEVWD
jgi:Zn-dependent peptidase ImmA (M78 family)